MFIDYRLDSEESDTDACEVQDFYDNEFFQWHMHGSGPEVTHPPESCVRDDVPHNPHTIYYVDPIGYRLSCNCIQMHDMTIMKFMEGMAV